MHVHLSTNGSYFPFLLDNWAHRKVQKVISAWVMTNINGYNKLLLKTLITKKNRLILGGFYTKKSIIKWHFSFTDGSGGNNVSPSPQNYIQPWSTNDKSIFFSVSSGTGWVSCRLLVFFALLLHSFSCSY